MQTIKRKFNPYTWFFAYTRKLEGYNKEYEKIIREGIVYQYSKGKTESLKELFETYPIQYAQMKKQLQFEQLDETDKGRKRLIAVLFSFCHFKGYPADMDYVKKVACNAAQEKKFNNIPLIKLRELYRIFGDIHSKAANKWANETLNLISKEVQNEKTEH